MTNKKPKKQTKAAREAEIAARIKAAGERALAEAAARADAAKAADGKDHDKPVEINGPKGPEPTRFGDWERKGIAIDF